MTARDPIGKSRFCRACGCTERAACVAVTPAGPVACCWILLDLDAPTGICSECAIALAWDQTELAAFVGTDGPTRPLLVAS